MPDGTFKHEDCLLKHYIRKNGWLPLCRKRLQKVRDQHKKNPRRIRYFTFCAVGAIDVLMLDVANVIRRSNSGKFDTVVFFDQNPEYIHETQKRIPGAIGFPGDFTAIVLLQDPEEELAIDNTGIDTTDPLQTPTVAQDIAITHNKQVLLAQRQEFIKCFPFDVVNLDLEEFLFKPNDPIPGRVVNAMRRVFEWQCKPLTPNGDQYLSGFSLMFTTQVGPPNLSNNYLTMLEGYLQRNIQRYGDLQDLLNQRTGIGEIALLRGQNFEEFFKLAMPKVLASILLEQDWYVDPQPGITVFEFERPSTTGPYKMLHLVMDVRRQNPRREDRPPLHDPAEAAAAYETVVRQIFVQREIVIAEEMLDKEDLESHLQKIFARRKKYYKE